jgi:cell filamentation protein
LRDDNYLAVEEFGDSVNGAAKFLADLNAIHPFRDGNGRTQFAFMHLLAIKAGHPLDLSLIKPERFLASMETWPRGSRTSLGSAKSSIDI